MRVSNFFLFPMFFYLFLWGMSSFIPKGIQKYELSQGGGVSQFLVHEGYTSEKIFTAKKTESQEEIQVQLQLIDDQIRELEEKKRGYLSKALRHDDQAERLQFRQEWFLEAKRHMELADENRAAADEIQLEIDRLKKRRTQILQQNGAGDGFEDL